MLQKTLLKYTIFELIGLLMIAQPTLIGLFIIDFNVTGFYFNNNLLLIPIVIFLTLARYRSVTHYGDRLANTNYDFSFELVYVFITLVFDALVITLFYFLGVFLKWI